MGDNYQTSFEVGPLAPGQFVTVPHGIVLRGAPAPPDWVMPAAQTAITVVGTPTATDVTFHNLGTMGSGKVVFLCTLVYPVQAREGTGPRRTVGQVSLPMYWRGHAGGSTSFERISPFTGTGVKGTVVVSVDDLAFDDGLNDYEDFTLDVGIRIRPSTQFTPIIIRARSSITINGIVDADGINIGGDGPPFSGSSPGTAGGGGGGGGGTTGGGNEGQIVDSRQGYFYGAGASPVGGSAGTGATPGGDGMEGVAGVSLGSFNPGLFAFLDVYPGATTAMVWGGMRGRRGAPGGDGTDGVVGGAAGGPGGNIPTGGGEGGGLILLIAPFIEFGPAALLRARGVVGDDGADGDPGTSTVVAGDDGGGGGGGQSGGGGGGGGAILVAYSSILDNGVTTVVIPAVGGVQGVGGAGGAGGAGGNAGTAGGDGSPGPTGSVGLVRIRAVV